LAPEKSEFIKYPADKIGLKILKKRTSDLYGMYAGKSKKNIAAAFKEAEEKNMFLLFDARPIVSFLTGLAP
jgi:SpoVK/Ycf46/Vps4 family AAA+-type ATPase